MKLTTFKENEPYTLEQFPFNDMYTADKFFKIGINGDTWLGVLTTISSYPGEVKFDSIEDFTSIQTGMPVTKDEIISYMYPKDIENKILRDTTAGRNLDKFNEYDSFIESI